MARSTTTAMTPTTPTTLVWAPPKGVTAGQAGSVVCSFLDTAATSFDGIMNIRSTEARRLVLPPGSTTATLR